MIFSSFTFLFLFLPLVWTVVVAVRDRHPEAGFAVLVAASLAFYGYWDIRFLPLLMFSIGVNYALGEWLHRAGKSDSGRFALIVGVVFNLGLLGFFKYANFFSASLDYLSGVTVVPFHILLPIGISFFTFQQITYLVDVRAGGVPRYSLLHYALFVSFFPQLIAGPIVHHSQIMPQFLANARQNERLDWVAIAAGLSIFIAGLFKKLVLADNMSPYPRAVFGAADAGLPVSFFECWGALFAFSFQLYFDFSGYCDMAIGLGLLFGIRLPINFNSPYKSRTIGEYWRRWNMTLGHFLRQYLYLPLGGGRRGEAARLRNLMLVMTVSGIWHGAGLGFILWGMLNGVWLWCNHASARFHAAIGRTNRSLIPAPVAVATVFLAVSFGWTMFRPVSTEGMVTMIRTSLGLNGIVLPEIFAGYLGETADAIRALGIGFAGPAHVGIGDWSLRVLPLSLLSACIVWAMPNTNQIFLAWIEGYRTEPQRLRLSWSPSARSFASVAATFVLAMLFAGTISEFLYFQF